MVSGSKPEPVPADLSHNQELESYKKAETLLGEQSVGHAVKGVGWVYQGIVLHHLSNIH